MDQQCPPGPEPWTRRRTLAAVAALSAGLAGCAEDAGDDSDDGSDDAADGGGGGADTDDLDLAQANVLDVDLEAAGERRYHVSVTLLHDDEGEDGYANWWQVETPGGETLGRRELTHGHGTESFTRSETVTIPEDHDCVVVRGHDQTHEYGGQTAVVAVPDGEFELHRQGEEPESFDGSACP